MFAKVRTSHLQHKEDSMLATGKGNNNKPNKELSIEKFVKYVFVIVAIILIIIIITIIVIVIITITEIIITIITVIIPEAVFTVLSCSRGLVLYIISSF
ncbi:hypothetical protein FHG87_002052 [Trinorchestia longiramus]|nr:hypothetical protein FHG87_002052 [Trinorchestia longiramus]